MSEAEEREFLREVLREARSKIYSTIRERYGDDVESDEIHITIELDVIKKEGAISVSV